MDWVTELIQNSYFLAISTTLIGIGATLILYWFSIRKPNPIFVMEHFRAEIFNSKKFGTAPIKIFKRDKKEVKENLYMIRFYFWNSGQKEIFDKDVLKPIIVTINEAEIVDVKILKTSREVCNIGINLIDKSSFEIHYKILEYEDGFSGQLIYEGGANAPIEINGVIVGAKNISKKIPFSLQLKNFIKFSRGMLIATLIYLILLMIGYFTGEATLGFIFFLLFSFLVFFSWMSITSFLDQYRPLKNKEEYVGLTERVPVTIVP